MQYRVIKPLTYNRSGTEREDVTVPVDTIVDPVAVDLLPFHHAKGIRGQIEDADAAEPPYKLIAFQFEGGPRTAVIGVDVVGVRTTKPRWTKGTA